SAGSRAGEAGRGARASGPRPRAPGRSAPRKRTPGGERPGPVAQTLVRAPHGGIEAAGTGGLAVSGAVKRGFSGVSRRNSAADPAIVRSKHVSCDRYVGGLVYAYCLVFPGAAGGWVRDPGAPA